MGSDLALRIPKLRFQARELELIPFYSSLLSPLPPGGAGQVSDPILHSFSDYCRRWEYPEHLRSDTSCHDGSSSLLALSLKPGPLGGFWVLKKTKLKPEVPLGRSTTTAHPETCCKITHSPVGKSECPRTTA